MIRTGLLALAKKSQVNGDIDQDDSAVVKRMLDTADGDEHGFISQHFPAEYSEWHEEVLKGYRERENLQQVLV